MVFLLGFVLFPFSPWIYEINPFPNPNPFVSPYILYTCTQHTCIRSEIPSFPRSVAIDPESLTLFFTRGDSLIVDFHLPPYDIDTVISLPSSPRFIEFLPVQNLLFVFLEGSTKIFAYRNRLLRWVADLPLQGWKVIPVKDIFYVLGPEGCILVDFQDSAQFILYDTLTGPSEFLSGIPDLEAGLLYLSRWGEIDIFDISDPHTPMWLNTWSSSGYAWDLDLIRSHIILLSNGGDLSVVDFHNPYTPKVLARFQSGALYGDVLVQGHHGVAVMGYDFDTHTYLVHLDLSDPENPAEDTTVALPRASTRLLFLRNDTLYVALRGSGAYQYEDGFGDEYGFREYWLNGGPGVGRIIWGLRSPQFDFWWGQGMFRDLDVTQDFLLVAGNSTGLHVWDVRDPSRPWHTTQFVGASDGVAVRVAADTVYYAGKTDFYVLLLNHTGELQRMDSLHFPGRVLGFDLEKNLVAFARSNGQLALFQRTPAFTPLGSLGLGGVLHDVKFLGDSVILVADGVNGLHVVDIRNPQRPRLVRTVSLWGDAWDLFVFPGDTLLGVAGENEVYFLSLKNPWNPSVISSLSIPGWALGISGGEPYAVVVGTDIGMFASWQGFVYILDLQNPHRPRIVDSIVWNRNPWDVDVVQGPEDTAFIWVVGHHGILGLEYSPTRPDSSGDRGGSEEGNTPKILVATPLTSGTITLTISPVPSPLDIWIYSTTGQLAGEVHTHVRDSSVRLNLPPLATGKYVLRIQTPRVRRSFPVMLLHPR